MIAHATAHRRANAFAQALDERAQQPGTAEGTAVGAGPNADERGSTGPGGAHAANRPSDPIQARMLALTEGLGGISPPELDPEVKAVQRAQLVAAMENAFAGGTLDPEKVVLPGQRDRRPRSHRATAGDRLRRFRPRSRWGRRLAAGGLAMTAAASGLGAAAAASTDALPGDTLYGLKRGMEDLQLTLADNEAERGETLLDMASTRLNEAVRLMERSKAGPLDDDQIKDIRKALAGMQQEASEGHHLLSSAYQRNGSLDPIQALASFTDRHRAHWTRLSERLPGQLASERDQVSSVLEAIEEEVVPLRPLLPELDEPAGRPDQQRDGVDVPGLVDQPGGPGQRPAPSSSQKPEDRKKGKAPQPGASSAPDTSEDGLLGGNGLLEPPSGQDGDSDDGDSPDEAIPEVTLPPLLPGLFPGLDITPDDD